MMLSKEEVLSMLHQQQVGWHLELHDEVTSTNDLIKVHGLQGAAHGLVVTAESQTAGRGQRSNRWVTPKGNDLMFSLLLRPTPRLELWPRLTTLAAVAVCRAIEESAPVHVGIKWPNDIYLNGKKVSGLLAETTLGPGGMFVVLGIGININTLTFPEELLETATSLRLAIGHTSTRPLPREGLLACFLNHLDELMASAWDEGFPHLMMEVRQRSTLIGKNIRATVEGRPTFGRVRDLNHEGHLVLEQIDGSTEILTSAAEVRLTS
jgi:BirA family transcriptional regulator, biotin operon repressor / biotin---[acetyl-CoA-carboxylase] ligase